MLGCWLQPVGGVSASDEVLFEVLSAEPAGNRRLGVAISEGEVGFGVAFLEARKAGVQIVELNLPWDMFERGEGEYQDPFGLLPATAYYGANDIQVCFSIAVINTVKRTTPGYLKGVEFDDPKMVEAFNRLMDWFLAKVPDNVTVAAISVGHAPGSDSDGHDQLASRSTGQTGRGMDEVLRLNRRCPRRCWRRRNRAAPRAAWRC